jgi:hypothetical protein
MLVIDVHRQRRHPAVILQLPMPILCRTNIKRDHSGALWFELMIMKYTIVFTREAIEGLKVFDTRQKNILLDAIEV